MTGGAGAIAISAAQRLPCSNSRASERRPTETVSLPCTCNFQVRRRVGGWGGGQKPGVQSIAGPIKLHCKELENTKPNTTLWLSSARSSVLPAPTLLLLLLLLCPQLGAFTRPSKRGNADQNGCQTTQPGATPPPTALEENASYRETPPPPPPPPPALLSPPPAAASEPASCCCCCC